MSCTNRLIAVPPFIAKMSLANTSGATVSKRRTVSA
jgi:hypothetical protein